MRNLIVVMVCLSGCHDVQGVGETRAAVRNSSSGSRAYGTLAMGYDHGCALGRDGTVQCWGNNLEGELGNGTTVVDSTTPVQVSGLTNQVYVSAGGSSACSVGADGTAWCWGFNNQGQLGNGTTGGPVNGGYNTPQQVYAQVGIFTFPLTSVVEIAVGTLHACARDSAGGVWCWGENQFGELGDGTTTNRSYAVGVQGITGVVALTAGSYHTCAILADHTARCWGENNHGQLGTGGFVNSLTPVTVSGVTSAVDITAMENGTCALLESLSFGPNNIQCWGEDDHGEMGNGTVMPNQPAPASALPSPYPIAIARNANASTMCSITSSGQGQCWGFNANGETGSGNTTSPQAMPVYIGATGGSPVNEIALGFQHGCARTSDGNIWCWGENASGQLGNGTTTNSTVPVYNLIPKWTSPSQRIAVTASPLTTVCAISSALGNVDCWGAGLRGELGNGTTPMSQATPVQVTGLSNVVAISAGQDTFQALTGDGYLWCWGLNSSSECATVGPNKTTPIKIIPGPYRTEAMVMGCSVAPEGLVWCWGPNQYGQTGNGNITTPQTAPVLVPVNNITAISGQLTRCAIRTDGIVLCWGQNSQGQGGNGSVSTYQLSPVPVSGLSNVIAISGDNGHKCAIRNNGTVWCWGANNFGQLGDGTTTDRHTPVQVVGMSGAIAFAGTSASSTLEGTSCVIRGDGTEWCWGANDYGQLGIGTTGAPQTTPVQVSGMANTLQVAVGFRSSYALRADGTLWAWGDNTWGQLGFGTVGGTFPTPAQSLFQP